MNNHAITSTLSDVPSLTVNQVISQLSDAYISVIRAGLPMKSVPSCMLWGQPGVGKSQAVRQIAGNIESATGRSVSVTDVRLMLFNPIDLRGIPTANADKTLAVWLKPQIFQMDPSDGIINILFLDEISAAPQSVQAAAYQITLDRVIGEHRLPDNCIVICAGNRVTDKSVSFKMPKALSNRLMHFEISDDFSGWHRWAVENNVNPKVVGFLGFRPQLLNAYNPEDDSLAFATPRAWEMVSNILNHVSDDVDKVYPLVAGLVGTGTAVEFRTWCAVWNKLPDVESIFNGTCRDVPSSPDVLYALVSAMAVYAKAHRNEPDKIENSIIYASRMPADFAAVLLVRDYLYLEKDYKVKLMQIPAFQTWARQHAKAFASMK